MIRYLFLISTLIFMNKDETQKGPNIHGSSEPVFHLMTYLHMIYCCHLKNWVFQRDDMFALFPKKKGL